MKLHNDWDTHNFILNLILIALLFGLAFMAIFLFAEIVTDNSEQVKEIKTEIKFRNHEIEKAKSYLLDQYYIKEEK